MAWQIVDIFLAVVLIVSTALIVNDRHMDQRGMMGVFNTVVIIALLHAGGIVLMSDSIEITFTSSRTHKQHKAGVTAPNLEGLHRGVLALLQQEVNTPTYYNGGRVPAPKSFYWFESTAESTYEFVRREKVAAYSLGCGNSREIYDLYNADSRNVAYVSASEFRSGYDVHRADGHFVANFRTLEAAKKEALTLL